MTAWSARDFSVAEAAKLCGFSEAHFRVILHRNKPIQTLFSEKRSGRRWFSRKDICVLKVGHVLERFGRTYLMGIADAFDRLERPPPEDTIIVLTLGRSLPQCRRMISDRDVPRLPVGEATLLVPIGRIVANIIKEAA